MASENAVQEILQFFRYGHLPVDLQVVSKQFYVLAHEMARTQYHCEELLAGLRKLLEAKDCFVRTRVKQKDLT